MYIDPLKLFIVGEIVVVIIIITIFLFYKSRLLRVLLALWHEMRMKRLRRDSPLDRKINQLQEHNRALTEQIADLKEGGAESYSDQVQARLDALADQEADARADDAEAAAEVDNDEETHRTRAILRAFYEFEAARADPTHKDIRAAEDTLLEQLKIQLGRDLDEEDSEYVQGQTVDLLARVAELEPLEAQHAETLAELAEARKALNKAEGQAAALTAIKDATSDSADTNTSSPLPPGSQHEDEIYRLKCERFDMMESINKLRLQLQKVVSDGEASDLIEIQNEQIHQQEQYIKDTDTAFNLLEADLAAAQARAAELELALNQSGASLDPAALSAAQQERKETLAGYAEQQKSSMAEMRENLVALRAAEKSEERAALIQTQEDRLTAMARAVEESDMCVAMMETELHTAHETIIQLQEQLDDQSQAKTAPEQKPDQDSEEMATMLEKFVTDSADLMACLKGLENENKAMRDQLIAQGANPDELPSAPLPTPAS